MADHNPELIQIESKLNILRSIDPSFRPGKKLTDAEVEAWERRFKVRLPTEYRQFVQQIGHGVSGHYVALHPLDKRSMEDATDRKNLYKPFKWDNAFNPREWINPCDEEGVVCDADDQFLCFELPGALYVCHHGCGICSFIVVTGNCTGQVWLDSQADGEGFTPVLNSKGERVGFLEWYQQWLDKSIASLSSSPPAQL